MADLSLVQLKEMIVNVPDFPKPGILFKDITPILENPAAFRSLIYEFCLIIPENVTKIVAIESRGFILGAAIAHHFNKGLVLVRKPGKLPRKTYSQSYALEYGTDSLEIHQEALGRDDKVIIIDDVLATGGTAHAVESLCKTCGAEVLGHRFLLEISFLQGRKKLQAETISLMT